MIELKVRQVGDGNEIIRITSSQSCVVVATTKTYDEAVEAIRFMKIGIALAAAVLKESS